MNTDKRTEMIWWIAKHRRLTYVLGFLCMVILDIFLMEMDIPVWFIFAVLWVIAFYFAKYVNSCPQRAQIEALRELALWCDPKPLLRDTSDLLDYKHAPAYNVAVLLNHCYALRESGEYGKAYEQLTALKDKVNKRVDISLKLILFNNLADVCTMLDRYDEAEQYYEKLVELYRKTPEKKQNEYREQSMREAEADHFYRQQEYRQAVDLLNSIKPYDLCEEIGVCMLQAKAYLKLGDMENAKEKLEFVIKKGNKLYAVKEAKQLMETLCVEL